MIRHYRAGLRYAQLVADLLVVATSFLLAWYLRFEVDLIPRWAPIPDFRAYLLLLGLILAVWAVLLQVEGAGRQRRYRALGEEIGGLIQVHAIGILLVFAIIFFTRFYSFSRVMILLFWSVSTVAASCERWRAGGSACARSSWSGPASRRVRSCGASSCARSWGSGSPGCWRGSPAGSGRRCAACR